MTRPVLGTVVGVRTRRNVAALTFDDGPDPVHTPHLLDILADHGARATFFMVGEMARRYPDVVRRVAEEGHAIGNHTWDHPSLPKISDRERRRQMRACREATRPYGLRLLRPPYGHLNLASRLTGLFAGYEVVGWNADVEDWRFQDSEAIAERIGQLVRPGAVFVLHDSLCDVRDPRAANREYARRGLGMALAEIGERFQFVTIPELLRTGRPVRTHWNHVGDREWLSRSRTRWAGHYARGT